MRPFPRHTLSFDVRLSADLAREALDGLREAETCIVPLWQHVFERPDTAPSAGIVSGLSSCTALDYAGRGESLPTPLSWPSWAALAAPASLARFVGDTRTARHLTRRVGVASVSFQLLDHKEQVAAYAGPTSGGLPLFDVFTETASGISESTSVSQNLYDTGLLDGLSETRHGKRSFTVTLTLNTRAQILAFRQLMFAVKGRLNPVAWTPPVQGEAAGVYRLASDSVLISYLRPNYATCTLTLTQL